MFWTWRVCSEKISSADYSLSWLPGMRQLEWSLFSFLFFTTLNGIILEPSYTILSTAFISLYKVVTEEVFEWFNRNFLIQFNPFFFWKGKISLSEMAVTEICLKWDNHHNNLVSCLYSQLENKIVADVMITAEGKCINVHRLVLCASSPYFEVS